MILAVVLLALVATSQAKATQGQPMQEIQTSQGPDITCLVEHVTFGVAGLTRDWVMGYIDATVKTAEFGLELVGCFITGSDKLACLEQGVDGGWKTVARFFNLSVHLVRETLDFVSDTLKCLQPSRYRPRIA